MTNISSLLAIAAMLGMAAPGNEYGNGMANEPKPDDSEFVKASKWFRAQCRGRLVWSGSSPYQSKRPHLGKKVVRKAKRLKVAAMKAAGHFRGDNRPFAA